jgi:hypothetical protein
MSDEKNTQPDVENENRELSEEELNDVAGGSYSWGANQTLISSYSTPQLPPNPLISPDLKGGIKGN